MADYTRNPSRFFYRGISLVPEDALGPGKVALSQNIRSYEEGTVTPRWGLTRQSPNGDLPGTAAHSLFRLTDTSQAGGNAAVRFVGTGTQLWSGGTTPGAFAQVAGLVFSGNPLTGVLASPYNSPRPYLYIGDSVLQQKINTDLTKYSIGIPTPTAAPTAALSETLFSTLVVETGAGWYGYGVATGAAYTPNARVNTVISHISYDVGATRMCSIALADMTNVVPGMDLHLAGSPYEVQDVIPPVASTTVGRILYDVGTSGLCTIQPSGSFTAGLTEAALPDAVRRRYEDLNLPVPPNVTINRTVDFPVNGLVTLNGIETVQILSIAIGPDGSQSFRCSTASTIAAGQAITGVSCFRTYTPTTRANGDAATGSSWQVTITPAAVGTAVVGGLQANAITGAPLDWSRMGTPGSDRATQSEDVIRIVVRCSSFAYLQSIRLMLAVSIDTVGTSDFLHNYYVYEWRKNDLATAVQATAGAVTGSMTAAQATAVTNGQTSAQYSTNYGTDPSIYPNPYAPPMDPGNPTYSPVPSPLTLPTDGFVTAGSTPSRQLSLGDNQWVTLQCRVADLTRIGTDFTKTLANINAVAITAQILGTIAPVTVEFADGYLMGGFGPDVGTTLPPYVYRYRYRSTITGERSNPSPPMRAGIHPHRMRVEVTPTKSDAAQVDIIDWFRYGGALARWQYTHSAPNTSTMSYDTTADTEIDGGETLATDLYQPWPSYDLPRSGVVEVAGTALKRVSGDNFNTGWAPGTIVIVNGVSTTLYQSPSSTTRMEVVDNAGEAATTNWSMPDPIILGQPLPAMWGGPINDVWFNFACGDPVDPSLLHWTHGNDPDATSFANTLVVSSGSQPLQNGFFFDGQPYVFSTDRLYRIVATFGNVTSFRCVETPCTKGLWSRWAFAIAPEGIYFLGKDGIYLTAAGSQALSITEEDLKVLFPQDGGSAPAAVRGLNPIDFTQTTKLKLTYVDSELYFDYQDTQGNLRTLVYEPLYKRWTPDVYALTGVTSRLAEPGPQVHTNLIGCANGNLYQGDSAKFDDAGAAIAWTFNTPWDNGNDARQLKQYGDAVIDAIGGEGFTVTPVSGNGATAAAATTIAASAVRATSLVEVNAGAGVLSRNFGLQLAGNSTAASVMRALLYLWEPAFLLKQVSVGRRATDWDNLGYVGAKFIQGVVIRANTFNASKLAEVQYEGGHVGVDLTLIHDGEVQYAYPIAPGGWTPFICELVRIIGTDDLPWTLLDWRWVWEPAPEASTQWQTQETTFDLPGFISVRDANIAYMAHCPVTLTVWHGNTSVDYTLPATSDLYSRYYLPLQAAKGTWVKFRLTADSPFRVFSRDTTVRVQGWGVPGGFMLTSPFGGPSRVAGAQV